MAHKGKKFPPEVYDKSERDRLLNAFSGSKAGVRNKALITLYLQAQLRCEEALTLRTCDVNLEERTVTVLCGKGGKRRTAAIAGSVDAILRWSEIRPQCPYFFCTSRGTRIRTSYVRNLLKRMSGKAGIEKRLHCHGLRHTGAFELANAGLELRKIQRQLGHTSLAVTERYISHLCPKDVFTAVHGVEF